MNHGKYESRNIQHKNGRNRNKIVFILSLLLITTIAVGGTLAYLFTQTDPVENTFQPSHVTCEVTEEFDGTTKKNVNVTNTGDTDAYIRVKLVSYRVNESGEHIGGTATIPTFTPGSNWQEYDGYYYYTLPVQPEDSPDEDLIEDIALEDSYDDADGGKQVIEVMAEAIQSSPARAVGEAWGVTISEGSVTEYPAEGGA